MITQVNNAINGVVWGPFGLALLFCTGFWMSARTGFFQFRKMGYWLRHTIGAIFTNKDITAHTSKEDMAISQFQSMCTALAGTIGTGNIVGVATAIVSGGPGAIFWMWVMALLGMMTSFSENVLGVYYRRKNEKARLLHSGFLRHWQHEPDQFHRGQHERCFWRTDPRHRPVPDGGYGPYRHWRFEARCRCYRKAGAAHGPVLHCRRAHHRSAARGQHPSGICGYFSRVRST